MTPDDRNGLRKRYQASPVFVTHVSAVDTVLELLDALDDAERERDVARECLREHGLTMIEVIDQRDAAIARAEKAEREGSKGWMAEAQARGDTEAAIARATAAAIARATAAEAERDAARRSLETRERLDDAAWCELRACEARVERDAALARAETAEARCESLSADVERYHERSETYLRERNDARHKRAALSVRCEGLATALAWYADANNYQQGDLYQPAAGAKRQRDRPALNDAGDRARRALAAHAGVAPVGDHAARVREATAEVIEAHGPALAALAAHDAATRRLALLRRVFEVGSDLVRENGFVGRIVGVLHDVEAELASADAPSPAARRRAFLEASVGEVTALIASLPEGDVLGRDGLGSHLDELRAELAAADAPEAVADDAIPVRFVRRADGDAFEVGDAPEAKAADEGRPPLIVQVPSAPALVHEQIAEEAKARGEGGSNG